jgi:hypothetical protein
MTDTRETKPEKVQKQLDLEEELKRRRENPKVITKPVKPPVTK